MKYHLNTVLERILTNCIETCNGYSILLDKEISPPELCSLTCLLNQVFVTLKIPRLLERTILWLSLQSGLSLSTSLVWKRWISIFWFNLKQTGHSVSNTHWIFKVSAVTDGLWDRFLAHVDWWEYINISWVTLIYVAFKRWAVHLWFLLLHSLSLLQTHWDVCPSEQ